MHSLMGCRLTTAGQVHARNLLLKHAKIPSFGIEADQVDIRVFPEAEVKAQIEAFVETMEYYRRIRGQEGSA